MPDINDDFKGELPQEEPLVRCRIAIDGKLQRRLSRMSLLFGIVFSVVGALALVAYLSLTVIENVYPGTAGNLTAWLLGFGVPLLSIGLMLLFFTLRAIGNMEKAARENVYSFYQSCFFVSTRKGEEETGVVREAYSDCALVKERRGLILIYLQNGTFFPVEKRTLSASDAARLRELLPYKK